MPPRNDPIITFISLVLIALIVIGLFMAIREGYRKLPYDPPMQRPRGQYLVVRGPVVRRPLIGLTLAR